MTKSGTPGPSVSGTQTIQRAAAILRLLTAHNRTGLRLVDLYRGAMLERSTAHRILQGLIGEQLVSQHPANKLYFLGSRVYEMGLAAGLTAPRLQLRDVCHRYVQALAEQTGDTVLLAVRAGFDGVCVDRSDGTAPIRVFIMDVGRRRPLNIGGCNIAMLSTLPDEEVKRICTVNRERVAQAYPNYSDRTLQKRIAEVRSKGYLVNEILEASDARSIAMPVRDLPDGPAIAGISISAVSSRLRPARVDEMARLLRETVAKMEAEIAVLRSAPAA